MSTRKLRAVLTAVAILLGVAMISGTFLITDQIDDAFRAIFSKASQGVDVAVYRQAAFRTDQTGRYGGPLPERLVAKVRAVDGVSTAVGTIQASGSLVVGGKVRSTVGGAPSLVLSHAGPPFDVDRYVQGRAPQSPGEVAVIEGYARKARVHVGDTVGLTTRHGVRPVRVVGRFTFADVPSLGGATIVVTTLRDAQRWYDRRGQVSAILAAANAGVTEEQLRQRIRRVVGPGVAVLTGTQYARQQTADTAGAINRFLRPALLAFAGVAVLVGAFIIFNTFSITVAQRVREFGMLRLIGASRRQILASVVLEALVVALLSSIAGLGAGYLIAGAINRGFDAVGLGLPRAGLPLRGRTVVIALLVGVLVTLVASLVPAIRATRITPIAALREGTRLPRGRRAWVIPAIAAVLALVGLALLVHGFAGSGSVDHRLLGMAAGAVLIFIAVGMLARFVVRPGVPVVAYGTPVVLAVALALLAGFAARAAVDGHVGRALLDAVLALALAWLAVTMWPRGTIARLGREATRSNPARTAVTSAALMIGVGLVVFVAVFTNGLKVSFLGAIERSVKSDLIVTSTGAQAGSTLPPDAAAAMRRAPGVDAVAALEFAQVKVNGGSTAPANGVDPKTIARVYAFDWKQGGAAALRRLRQAGALVEDTTFRDRHLRVGQRLRLTSQEGRHATVTIAGVYRDPQLFMGLIVSNHLVQSLSSDPTGSQVILVKAAPGTSPTTLERGVKRSLAGFPDARVQSNAEYERQVEDQVDQLVYLLYGLLAMSVVISLFGIVNTLVLTIYERTREIGMLRAIGTTRPQMRRMIRYESVLTSVIGGLLGVVVGLVFGWIVTRGLQSEGISFAVPWWQLFVVLIVATAVGVVAAIWPAVRAARLDVLEALQYE